MTFQTLHPRGMPGSGVFQVKIASWSVVGNFQVRLSGSTAHPAALPGHRVGQGHGDGAAMVPARLPLGARQDVHYRWPGRESGTSEVGDRTVRTDSGYSIAWPGPDRIGG